ncbi:DUF1439 domain-containing protein [Ferrimonas sp. YFM]|uniref:DUF1439 domain-containing protein n=1 Tax=Ferrimonas sp. YFM TaxID=3028878 RepID=UPI002572AF00|nr:DUF1439 domain-containing protein [Ferrimonas sp. YFM]BDY03232.1 hypothetical protein F0521_02730 [Ferrimonas sp. YFM]
MRQLQGALVMGLLLTLGGCATSYTLDEKEVEGYLQDKLTIEERHSPIPVLDTEVNLNRIDVEIGRHNQGQVRVTTLSEFVIRTPLLPLRASLTATLAATPWYRPEDRGIYLRDLTLVEVKADPDDLTLPLERLGKESLAAVQLFLASQPIYTLDEDDWAQDILGRFGREITIEPGIIRFHLDGTGN